MGRTRDGNQPRKAPWCVSGVSGAAMAYTRASKRCYQCTWDLHPSLHPPRCACGTVPRPRDYRGHPRAARRGAGGEGRGKMGVRLGPVTIPAGSLEMQGALCMGLRAAGILPRRSAGSQEGTREVRGGQLGPALTPAGPPQCETAAARRPRGYHQPPPGIPRVCNHPAGAPWGMPAGWHDAIQKVRWGQQEPATIPAGPPEMHGVLHRFSGPTRSLSEISGG